MEAVKRVPVFLELDCSNLRVSRSGLESEAGVRVRELHTVATVLPFTIVVLALASHQHGMLGCIL